MIGSFINLLGGSIDKGSINKAKRMNHYWLKIQKTIFVK